MTEKKCSTCGEVKPLNKFHKDKSKKDGYYNQCKACKKEYKEANKDRLLEYKREYYQENRDRKREYYQENRDHILEYKREYHQDNRDRRLQYQREWYQENRDQYAEYYRQWAKENSEKCRAKNAKRRALKLSASTTDPWELQQIELFYGDRPDGWHVDHIMPLDLGGRHELSNLQHLEAWMNLSKHNKHPDDWDDPRMISCRA